MTTGFFAKAQKKDKKTLLNPLTAKQIWYIIKLDTKTNMILFKFGYKNN
jgi:hypothetical protein